MVLLSGVYFIAHLFSPLFLCVSRHLMFVPRVDKFLVEDLGLGEVVVGVRVRLTSSTVSPDWFLSHVMVQDLESGLSHRYKGITVGTQQFYLST